MVHLLCTPLAVYTGFSLEHTTSFITVAGIGNVIGKVGQGGLIISYWNLMFANSLAVKGSGLLRNSLDGIRMAVDVGGALVVSCDGVLTYLRDILG